MDEELSKTLAELKFNYDCGASTFNEWVNKVISVYTRKGILISSEILKELPEELAKGIADRLNIK